MAQDRAPHVEGELTLREVQLAALEVLKRIDAICQTEGIRYWVMYGTLIGAIRHKGFIPWDDDLDIAMPRPDYERFLAYCAEHAVELKPLVALHGNKDHLLPFLITRMSDTTYKMIGEYGDEVSELGAFVDVYPFDGCGDDWGQAVALKNECISEVTNYLRAANFQTYNKNAGRVKQVLKAIRASFMGDAAHKAAKLLKKTKTYTFYESRYVSCLEWPMDTGKLFICESLQCETQPSQFEGITVPIPKGYDTILTTLYGDYMSLPPEEDRVGHHYYTIIKRGDAE